MFLGKNVVAPVWILCFAVLDTVHVWRYNNRYLVYDFDVTLVLMCGCLKAISFAHTYSDGFKTEMDLERYVEKAIPTPKG